MKLSATFLVIAGAARRMALLDDAADTARSVPHLALVPVATTLLAFQKLVKTAGAGPGGEMKFPMPAALPDLWTFVAVPNTGVSFDLGVPLVFAPIFVVLNAAILAGFVGSIDAALGGRPPAFVEAVTDYTLPVLGVQVVVFVLTLLSFAPAAAGGMALAPLSALAALVVGYLTWAAPILVVVRDRAVADAFADSIAYALGDGRYASFSLAYLIAGAVGSLVLSTVVRGRLVLVLLATVLLAYPLLVLAIATVGLVKSLPARADDTGGRPDGSTAESG